MYLPRQWFKANLLLNPLTRDTTMESKGGKNFITQIWVCLEFSLLLSIFHYIHWSKSEKKKTEQNKNWCTLLKSFFKSYFLMATLSWRFTYLLLINPNWTSDIIKWWCCLAGRLIRHSPSSTKLLWTHLLNKIEQNTPCIFVVGYW